MPNWKKKTVTMVIEIRTTAGNEELARAVTDQLNHGTFREAMSTALYASIGDEFEIVEGTTVEVEDEKPA